MTLLTLPARQAGAPAPAVTISVRVLGAFQVLRDGSPVPLSQWRSRKARDLLKILVIRAGRPATRQYLMETLWPDDDPSRLSNRLSVALATLRSVLDPHKRHAPDHFVSADNRAVSLNEHVAVDLDTFLADATAGLDRTRTGRPDEAAARLASAASLYRGDVLEEDAYEDWAVMARERARITYVNVARALARFAHALGDLETAIEYQLRILQQDAYDEHAHLELVALLSASGRHGEAQRQHAVYATRMADLGLEPRAAEVFTVPV